MKNKRHQFISALKGLGATKVDIQAHGVLRRYSTVTVHTVGAEALSAIEKFVRRGHTQAIFVGGADGRFVLQFSTWKC